MKKVSSSEYDALYNELIKVRDKSLHDDIQKDKELMNKYLNKKYFFINVNAGHGEYNNKIVFQKDNEVITRYIYANTIIKDDQIGFCIEIGDYGVKLDNDNKEEYTKYNSEEVNIPNIHPEYKLLNREFFIRKDNIENLMVFIDLETGEMDRVSHNVFKNIRDILDSINRSDLRLHLDNAIVMSYNYRF